MRVSSHAWRLAPWVFVVACNVYTSALLLPPGGLPSAPEPGDAGDPGDPGDGAAPTTPPDGDANEDAGEAGGSDGGTSDGASCEGSDTCAPMSGPQVLVADQ